MILALLLKYIKKVIFIKDGIIKPNLSKIFFYKKII